MTKSSVSELFIYLLLGGAWLCLAYYVDVELRGKDTLQLDAVMFLWFIFMTFIFYFFDNKIMRKLKNQEPLSFDLEYHGIAGGAIQVLGLIIGIITAILLASCKGWGFYPFSSCETLYWFPTSLIEN